MNGLKLETVTSRDEREEQESASVRPCRRFLGRGVDVKNVACLLQSL